MTSVRARFRQWRRRRRRRRAAKRERQAPLREFVYLDDVSVYSLIASRLGAVATEFTASESSSLRGEVESSVGVSAGIAKADVGAQTESTQTAGSQVVRKSIVQSTFKELVDLERDSMALRTPALHARVPTVARAEDLRAVLDSSDREAWVVDPQLLQRGALVEIEVELEAEAIFRVSTILSTLLEILEETPELAAFSDRQGLLQAVAANRVLDQLLVGLVPLRGRAVDYRHVTVGDQELLVHQRLLEQLPESAGVKDRPLQVVGVAEADLFWRDIRRVLFSHSHYVVLGRLGRDSVQRDWTPVKLVEVLREVLPDLASSLDNAGEGLLTAMQRSTSEADGAELARERMKTALVRYAGALAAHYDKTCTEDDLAAAGLPTEAQNASYGSLEARRAAFAEITEHLARTLELPEDRLVAAEARFAALNEVGLGEEGQGTEIAGAPPRTSGQQDSRYLDLEMVGIYW